jgi:hypothetical protein
MAINASMVARAGAMVRIMAARFLRYRTEKARPHNPFFMASRLEYS